MNDMIKRQYKILIGMFIRLVVATTIQSEDVSYMRNGTTKTVKDALDELVMWLKKWAVCCGISR